MKARELMTERPETLTEKDSLATAAQRMRDLNVGLIPVVADGGDGRLTGVITDRDIAVRHVAEGHGEDCCVGDEMTREPLFTVGPDDEASTVMARMREGQVRRVPVLEDGRLVGIIAQADLAVETSPAEAEEVAATVERISEPARPTR
ncbi:MAG: CBS domain-containing protein [Gemmatimonadota bacterium]|jgi:CBS domain-containing protein